MSGRVAASLLRAALPPPAAATLVARTLDGIHFSCVCNYNFFHNAFPSTFLVFFDSSDYVDIAAQLLQASDCPATTTTIYIIRHMLSAPPN